VLSLIGVSITQKRRYNINGFRHKRGCIDGAAGKAKHILRLTNTAAKSSRKQPVELPQT